MTREEAIKYWEEFLSEIPDLLKKGFSKEEAEKQEAACKLAIEALQERPKGRWELRRIGHYWGFSGEGYKWCYICSECGWVDGFPFEDRHNFCPNCGKLMETVGADMRESK